MVPKISIAWTVCRKTATCQLTDQWILTQVQHRQRTVQLQNVQERLGACIADAALLQIDRFHPHVILHSLRQTRSAFVVYQRIAVQRDTTEAGHAIKIGSPISQAFLPGFVVPAHGLMLQRWGVLSPWTSIKAFLFMITIYSCLAGQSQKSFKTNISYFFKITLIRSATAVIPLKEMEHPVRFNAFTFPHCFRARQITKKSEERTFRVSQSLANQILSHTRLKQVVSPFKDGNMKK